MLSWRNMMRKKQKLAPLTAVGRWPIIDIFFWWGPIIDISYTIFGLSKKKKLYYFGTKNIHMYELSFFKKKNNGKRKKCMESFYINQPRISCICSRLIFYTYKSFSLSYTCFNKSIVDNYLFFMNSKLDEKTI